MIVLRKRQLYVKVMDIKLKKVDDFFQSQKLDFIY